MQRLSKISQKVLVYCREIFKDSRLNNLDELSTGFGRNPLHVAVMSGDKRFARDILSSRPALALAKDKLGWTPLHLASARESLKMVKLLLKAEPNACLAKDEAQRTPLHLAAMNDRVEIMVILIEEAPPEAIHLKNDQNGETILHFCVKNSSIHILKLLVDKLTLARGLDPNINIIINSKDNSGITVLKLAAQTGKIEMVQYLLESNNLNLEITDADFAEALNALSPENKDNLETNLLKYPAGLDSKKHMSNTLFKNGDEQEGMKERVNALMVVATLIAGIAFQAAMNPPGGVWQDDSKVNSSTDPVIFAFYLNFMFGSSVSGGIDRYIQDNLQYPAIQDPDSWVYRDSRGSGGAYPSIAYFVKNLMGLYDGDRMYHDMAAKGLILEEFIFTDMVSFYQNATTNSSLDGFFPYLIRNAGYPILAYTYPTNYVIYMVTNGVALFASLTIIFLVVCGLMVETSLTQVRFLVVLMCISIGCIAFGYMSILVAMIPGFYFQAGSTFVIIQVIFGICCILGVWLFVWTLARKIVKLRKRRKHQHISVIDYFKAVFFGMDAKAAGGLILFFVSYSALRVNGYIYFGFWAYINPLLF